MKYFIAILFVFGIFSKAQAVEKKPKIDPREHTCSEMIKLLNVHKSIWVKGIFLPVYGNIALENPYCHGPRNHPNRICRYYEGMVTAKDGRCKLGRECSCRLPKRDRD